MFQCVIYKFKCKEEIVPLLGHDLYLLSNLRIHGFIGQKDFRFRYRRSKLGRNNHDLSNPRPRFNSNMRFHFYLSNTCCRSNINKATTHRIERPEPSTQVMLFICANIPLQIHFPYSIHPWIERQSSLSGSKDAHLSWVENSTYLWIERLLPL